MKMEMGPLSVLGSLARAPVAGEERLGLENEASTPERVPGMIAFPIGSRPNLLYRYQAGSHARYRLFSIGSSVKASKAPINPVLPKDPRAIALQQRQRYT